MAGDYAMDPSSRRWVEHVRAGHPRRCDEIATLHDALRRAALHELRRRRGRFTSLAGPELDDAAQQCADDPLVNILARVDGFRRLSRFTTRAYKFVIFEVSNRTSSTRGAGVARAWRRPGIRSPDRRRTHDGPPRPRRPPARRRRRRGL